MDIFEEFIPTQKELRRNVLGQGVKVLNALIEYYQSGSMEETSDPFVGLMMLVCEGRIKGNFDEYGTVKWAIAEQKEEQHDNIIPFPLTRRE